MTPPWPPGAWDPWLVIGVLLGAFGGLVAGLETWRRLGSPDPESLRKLLHVGGGLLTLAFPFVFAEVWPVLVLAGSSAAFIAALRVVPPLRATLGRVVGGRARSTLGEIYFPVSVALVFWLSFGRSPLLFCVPILVLTLADATGALVGLRYGRTPFTGAAKSLEGSVAFVVVAFLCVHVPLLLWSDAGRPETLLIAATLALLVMLLEGSAWRGLDNLFIPIGGYVLLSRWIALDADALLLRFLVTTAIVLVVLVFRRASTLEDDALLAGAFLSYVTWALAGWHWLVPPGIVFVGYAWMSPRTAENARRVHDVPAVLSVWSCAILWLALARVTGDVTACLPAFTTVFAAHLAMFGSSRLASGFPDRAVATLAAVAAIKGWAIVFGAFLIAGGVSAASLAAAAAALPGVALAVWLFVGSQPIRHVPATTGRWVAQAAFAGAASVVAWAIAQAAGLAGS